MASLFANPGTDLPSVVTNTNTSPMYPDQDAQSQQFLKELKTFCNEQDGLMKQAISDLDKAFGVVRATKGVKAKEAALALLKASLLEVDSPATRNQSGASAINKCAHQSPNVSNFWGDLLPNDGRDPREREMKFMSEARDRDEDHIPTSLTPMPPHELAQKTGGLSELSTRRRRSGLALDVLSRRLDLVKKNDEIVHAKDLVENEANRPQSCPPKESPVIDALLSASLSSGSNDGSPQPRTPVRLRRCSREFERHPSFNSEIESLVPKRGLAASSVTEQRKTDADMNAEMSRSTSRSRIDRKSTTFVMPRRYRYSRLQSETSLDRIGFNVLTRKRSMTQCDMPNAQSGGASLLSQVKE